MYMLEMTSGVSTVTDSVVGSTEIQHDHVSLFRSDSCAPTEACTDVQSLFEQQQRRLVTTQGRAEHSRARLRDMERHKAYTQDMLVQPHTALAPIERIPPEILSEIFEYCLDARISGVLFLATGRTKEAPLLLGRVCRSWRAIAHATSRLWQDVFVNVCDGRYSDALRRDALPVLQTWLAHSKSLPLHLVILCRAERVLPGLLDLFEAIAGHAARWKTVYVRLQYSPDIYRLVCRAFSRCTSLSTLDVTDGGQCMSFLGDRQLDEVEDVQPIAFDLPLAPLHELSLSLAGLAIRDVQASWAKLTRLFFMQDARSSTSSVTDYAAILQQCTSLKECGITIDGGVRDAPLEAVTLPSLERLSLRVLREASHTTRTGDFLSALRAPRLCSLSIEDNCPRRDAVSYHGQLKAFLRGRGKSLRYLGFSTSSKLFSSEDMIGLIDETPALMELEYHPDEVSSPRALLEALTPRVRGDVVECLLPCLERFFVYWDTTETVSMIGEMIERRYALVERGIARLKHLSCKPVRMNMAYDPECMPPYTLVENLAARLEPLCRCGLEVDWEAYRYDLEFSYC